MLSATFFILASQVLSTGNPQTKTYYQNGKPHWSETFHKASCTIVSFDRKGNAQEKWTYDFVLTSPFYEEFRDQISYIDAASDDLEPRTAEFITVTKLLNSICEVYSNDSEYGYSTLTVIRD